MGDNYLFIALAIGVQFITLAQKTTKTKVVTKKNNMLAKQ